MKLLVLWTGLVATAWAQQPTPNAEHTAWMAESLKSMQTIKVGMTRGDLYKVFTTEGGISSRFEETFVFRDCPLIHVRVEFEGAESPRDYSLRLTADRIKSISNPYLGWVVVD